MSRRTFTPRTFDTTHPRTTNDPNVHNANARSNIALRRALDADPDVRSLGTHLPRKTKKALRQSLLPTLAYTLALRALAHQQEEQLRARAAAMAHKTNPYLDPTYLTRLAQADAEHAALMGEANREDYQ